MKNASRQIIILIMLAFFIGCSSPSSTGSVASQNTPDGALQVLFKYAKEGKISAVREELMSSKYLDEADADRLRKLFAPDDVVSIETSVLENKNQEAKVRMTIVKKSEKRVGREPVNLVFQDGKWKIKYNGNFWPKFLSVENY